MFPTNAIFCCRFGSLFTYHLVANNVNKEKIDCVRPFHKLLIKPVRAKLACYYSSVHGFNFRERFFASANFQVEGNLQVPIEVLIAELITGGRIGADL